MVKRGPKYTPEEAEGRIPGVAKNVALQSVGLVIALENWPVNSREIEQRVFSLSGQVGYLARLFHVVWKNEGLKKYAEEGPVEGEAPIKTGKAFMPPPKDLKERRT